MLCELNPIGENMKTVKSKDGIVSRKKDKEATILVKSFGYSYCPKSEAKAKGKAKKGK
jgi:hypothetical protein